MDRFIQSTFRLEKEKTSIDLAANLRRHHWRSGTPKAARQCPMGEKWPRKEAFLRHSIPWRQNLEETPDGSQKGEEIHLTPTPLRSRRAGALRWVQPTIPIQPTTAWPESTSTRPRNPVGLLDHARPRNEPESASEMADDDGGEESARRGKGSEWTHRGSARGPRAPPGR